jgi:hypothetical protein
LIIVFPELIVLHQDLGTSDESKITEATSKVSVAKTRPDNNKKAQPIAIRRVKSQPALVDCPCGERAETITRYNPGPCMWYVMCQASKSYDVERRCGKCGVLFGKFNRESGAFNPEKRQLPSKHSYSFLYGSSEYGLTGHFHNSGIAKQMFQKLHGFCRLSAIRCVKENN